MCFWCVSFVLYVVSSSCCRIVHQEVIWSCVVAALFMEPQGKLFLSKCFYRESGGERRSVWTEITTLGLLMSWDWKSKQSSWGELGHKTNWFHAKIGQHAVLSLIQSSCWSSSNFKNITYFGTAGCLVMFGSQQQKFNLALLKIYGQKKWMVKETCEES